MAKKPLKVETLTHDEATRRNAPTAELEPLMAADEKRPILTAYERRNPDLDPQLVWRGKDVADWSDLVVNAPPLYIQEKIHPKALIEDLKRASARAPGPEPMADLFADFNGLEPDQRTEFYLHEQHWSNRMILGDGLQVMASLAEREGLKGQVQCIYIDPPYGIKFNSNFQWSTTSRDVKNGKADHLTREPEQVKAFRDTWRDGIHSYLTYLRDRLTVARDLLSESGSVFVQIGDENLHRIRMLMEEVFGEENFITTIAFKKKSATYITETVLDYIVWFSRKRDKLKIRNFFEARAQPEGESKFNTIIDSSGIFHNVSSSNEGRIANLLAEGGKWARVNYPIVSQHPSDTRSGNYVFRGEKKTCGGNKQWRFSPDVGLPRLERANRLFDGGGASLGGVVFWEDWNQVAQSNIWTDMHGEKYPTYVVQTAVTAVQRCILMTTDPGDLVLDPTCGSGTTAFVAEQWGRRWITIDTSRVALALARARIMGARYPWYLLADSSEGQFKEAEVTRTVPRDGPTHGRIRQGFVYKRVPRITLKSIANNAEIDTIWEEYQARLEPLRESLNAALGENWQDWQIPRVAADRWPEAAKAAHSRWWEHRVARQQEVDASIAAKADTEYLYDQPYTDNGRVRVAGPFTVESLSPHRVPAVDADDSLFDELEAAEGRRKKTPEAVSESSDFTDTILASLGKAGVQQAHKEDRIKFDSIHGWPGDFICAEGRFALPDGKSQRAGILVGPEYGTVAREDLMAAARESADAGFDLLIACAFNFDAHASEIEKLGRLAILKARINPDLHMPELADTGAGNLFTVFGEPDIRVHDESDGLISIEVAGVDMYKAGQIESSSASELAVWFVDTDYNYESFFVRHAYFPGANDPYKAMKTTLKADIDEDAWASLKRTRSRPFARPPSGQVAVKVINHLGDEVMKVVGV